jgi:hypothetical protein
MPGSSTERDALLSELWQFGAMLVLFVVVLILWLRIVYLPGRTLERWEARREKVAARPGPPDSPRV